MSDTQTAPRTGTSPTPPPGPGELRIESVIVPVADVGRAKDFYVGRLGWRLDADFVMPDGLAVVQVTPPGSPTSVTFGTRISAAAPGTLDSLLLGVHDVEAARADLRARGVDVSEVFHDAGGAFHHSGDRERVPGRDPQDRSYASFVAFQDPDGNAWYLQEIRERRPGR
ncbi:VOC family protein [Isoptericola sp. NPDC019693]|uniref:VOC family protein n=1 Tax=Isoptericola sp. NPDC019693 TaxID=3364009 RepID=UPI0037BD13B7